MFKLFARFASRPRLEPETRALQSLRSGDLEAAEAQFTALLEGAASAADRAFFLNKRGAARARLGLRETAECDFRGALEAQPAYAPALVNLGNLALEGGKFDDAIARYTAAIASDERYALAFFNLSVAFKRQGKIAESVRALRTAQKLEGRALSALRSKS
ncbi:MAG: tetratricopeptide repeat protein [Candidatus Eremiobacteraeota bacterium]|nr:tetratricopeptide repeat protein [Candidatus Eremiobacteraeota bacterium]